MLNEVKRRALAKTPPFFQRIRNGAIFATLVAGAVKLLPVAGISLPAWALSTCAYVIAVAPFVASTAQLAEDK